MQELHYDFFPLITRLTFSVTESRKKGTVYKMKLKLLKLRYIRHIPNTYSNIQLRVYREDTFVIYLFMSYLKTKSSEQEEANIECYLPLY